MNSKEIGKKEEIKNIVCDCLATKRIILFGVGSVAEEFYKKYKDKFNIAYCVSNRKKEWGNGKFLGILDIKKYQKEDIKETDYIVVCGAYAFRAIDLQLRDDGMQVYYQYVDSVMADVIFQRKKIALFYGQCILRDIYQSVIQVPEFNEEYASAFTQVRKKSAIINNRVVYYLKDICDLYVYTTKILDRDTIYSLKRSDLPNNCKVVSVSNLIVPIYWPQIDIRLQEYNQYYIHSYNADRNLDFYHTLYRRSDVNINKMVSEGISTKSIVQRLSSEDFYSFDQVNRNIKNTIRMIDIAERGVDVTILDALCEKYKSDMLYQNFTHPNKYIVWEYVRRLLSVIGIESRQIDRLEQESPMHTHQSGDVPIYPSVAKHMNLEFSVDDKRYQILTGKGVVDMTFEESIEYYAEYTKKAMEIMQMW